MPETEQKKRAPEHQNKAVQRCRLAWEHSYQVVLDAFKDREDAEYTAKDEALKAYRRAMPTLAGYENVRDFIACVGHAMLAEIMTPPEGKRLLYLAKVAITALRAQPGAPRRSAPEPQN